MNTRKYVLLIVPFLLCVNLLSQNTGPSSTETMGFEPVEATNMVNSLTGDLSYVIPLLEVPGPAGGYPVSLSYHSGIAEGQEASWVGLGWSLSVGAINRSVNGYADDQKCIRQRIMHIDPDEVTQTTFWLQVPYINIGLSYSYGQYKSFGVGLINFNFTDKTLGVGYGLSSPVASVSAQFNYNFEENTNSSFFDLAVFSFGINEQGYVSDVGLGSFSNLAYSLATEGISSLLPDIGYSSSKSQLSSAGDFVVENSYDNYNYFIGGKNVVTTRFSLHDVEYTYNYGVLYNYYAADDIPSALLPYWGGQAIQFNADVSEISDNMMSYYDVGEQDAYNFLLPAYDNYSVSAQGLSGRITPLFLNSGLMTGESRRVKLYDNGAPDEELQYIYDNTLLSRQGKLEDQIYFYYSGLNESYYNNSPGIFEYTNTLTYHGESVKVSNALGESNYNSTTGRLGQSSYVKHYYNKDLQNLSDCDPDFIEAESILNRTGLLFDLDGIGAFSITAKDGKTYHYSLPVYQFERVNHHDISDDKYYEEREHAKYAYTWLLTGITGPDYVDYNENHRLDEEDFGYWVKFTYGLWANGYYWQFPYEITDEDAYSFGRKQIYYLNTIETASHVALFVKDKRQDGLSRDIDKPETTNIVSVSLLNEYRIGEIFNAQTLVRKVTTEIHSEKINPLKLDRIILIKRENYDEDCKNFQSEDSFSEGKSGSYKCRYFSEHYDNYGEDNEILVKTYEVEPIDRTFTSEYEQFVIDVKDVEAGQSSFNSTFLSPLKTIEFNYDEDSPIGSSENSGYSNGGLLTLSSIDYYDRTNTSILPPYSFGYVREEISEYDDWGFEQVHPENNSLNRIVTPTGAVINIDYEPDSYSTECIADEATYGSLTLDSKNYTGYYDGDEYYIAAMFDISKIPFHLLNTLDLTYSLSGIIPAKEIGVQDSKENIVYDYSVVSFQRFELKLATKKIFAIWKAFDKSIDGIEEREGPVALKINIHNAGSNEITGGGIRVKSINLDNKYFTSYDYSGTNGVSSGVTTYAPHNMNLFVPYRELIPTPIVLYEYVTMKNENENGDYDKEITLQFEVPKSLNFEPSTGNLNLSDLISVEYAQKEQVIFDASNVTTGSDNKYVSRVNIKDNLYSIGRLKNSSTKNRFGEIINQTDYKYEDIKDLNSGVIKETFYSNKVLVDFLNDSKTKYNRNFYYNAVGYGQYKCPLKSETSFDGRNEVNTDYLKYNFDTGEPLIIETTNSAGDIYKSVSVPAYMISGQKNMGMKFEDEANKNMLTQMAASLEFKNNKVLGVGIQTWSNDWSNFLKYTDSGELKEKDYTSLNIWRRDKTFVWAGEIDEEGYLGTDFDLYNSLENIILNWNKISDENSASHDENWINTGEIVRFDKFSTSLESKDINSDFVALKKDPFDFYVIAQGANTSYISFAATGFESWKEIITGVYDVGSYILVPDNGIYPFGNNDLMAPHTGSYYLRVPTDAIGCKYLADGPNLITGQKYRAAVWVSKASKQNLKLQYKLNGVLQTNAQEEIGTFGDWTLIYHDFIVPEGTTSLEVYVESVGGWSGVDDFRVCPFNASVTSYVYDGAGQVTYMLNNDNFGTQYKYDNAGRLINTYVEKPTGFEKVSTNSYNYGSLNE